MKQLAELSPGIHLRAIQRVLGISLSSTRYQVGKLVHDGKLVCEKDGGFSRVYPSELDRNERGIYSILRKSTSRAIVAALIQEPNSRNKRIVELTGLAKSTVSEEIKKLKSATVVRRSPTERGAYDLEDRSMMIRSLARTDSSSLSRAVDGFVDLWDF